MLITFACFLLTIRLISGQTTDIYRQEYVTESKNNGSRVSKSDSLLMGITKSLMDAKMGATGDQNHVCIEQENSERSSRGFCKLSSITTLSSPCKFFKMANGFCDLPEILSLNMNLSNVALMLLLRGLIWGVSYVQGDGHKEARNEDGTSLAVGSLVQDIITETDVMLFLGYLVADESGDLNCLNRVACEQPARAESYLKSGKIIWKTSKMLNGAVKSDVKYGKILVGLQNAIDYGKTIGDCESKYKCSGPSKGSNQSNLTKI